MTGVQTCALPIYFWLSDIPTVQGSNSNPTLTSGNFSIEVHTEATSSVSSSGYVSYTCAVTGGQTVTDIANAVNDLGWGSLSARVISGKLCLYSLTSGNNHYINISGTTDLLGELGIAAGDYYQPALTYGTSAQMPLWQVGQKIGRAHV